MKAKKIAAVSSAIMLSATTALTGMPSTVLAQEQTENVPQTVTEEPTDTQEPTPDTTDNSDKQEADAAPETPDEQEPAASPETPDEQEPAASPETPDEQEPAASPETPDKQEPAASPETPDEQEPAASPETPDKQEPAASPETPDEQEPVAAPEGISINEKNFPDAAFRKYIEINFDTDKNSKGILTQEEINKVTKIRLSNTELSNVQGIEYFTELESLYISNSNLSSLTFKKMDKLTDLTIIFNKKLTKLDVSSLSNLEILHCYINNLDSINVSQIKTLREIKYHNNPNLTTLDFRGCDNLEVAYHSINQETVFISTGMTKYIGCNAIPDHTGNIVIDLDGFYTVNPDGSKSVDLSKVLSPKLIEIFAEENHPSFNKETNILTIPAGENKTVLQAGKDGNFKPTHWTFYTKLTAVDDRTVKFDTMGGSIVEDQIIANGTTATEPTAPSKEGYIFKGWYLDKDFSKPYDFSTPVTADITLYALWEKETVPNTPPTITAEDVTLTVGDTFNPLDYASASDKEDGDIKLTNENVIKNDVNTANAGTYHVTYKVTDKDGASTEKTIIVTVNPKPAAINTPPTIDADDLTLTVGDKFDPLNKVTATDKEDGNLKLTKDNVIKNNVDTSKAGTYYVTYKVTDKDGASTEKTIKVTVKEKKVNKKETPKTADMANVGLFGSMFAGSTGVLSILLRKKCRKT